MKYTVAILLLGFCICSCPHKRGPQSNYRMVEERTAQGIVKGNLLPGEHMESSPIVFRGQLLYVVSDRPITGAGALSVIIYDKEGNEISKTPTKLCLLSAFVAKDTLYVAGTTPLSPLGKSIEMIQTKDLVHFSAPTVLFAAPAGTTLYNSSIAPDDAGFVLAYEICRDGEACFNVRFKHSTDLKVWTDIGTQFQVGYYTACPTIRYIDDFYYLFYLSISTRRSEIHFLRKYFSRYRYNSYSTLVSRSRDLMTWEQSPKAVVAPDGPDVSRNSSDFDLIEFRGQVHMLYSVSPQDAGILDSVYGIRRARFNGPIKDFAASFFRKY